MLTKEALLRFAVLALPLSLLTSAPLPAADADGDGFDATVDCNDTDNQVWRVPGEAQNLKVMNKTTISWDAPADLGSTAGSIYFDVLRSAQADNFMVGTCFDLLTVRRKTFDHDTPPQGQAFFYLARGKNACGYGSPGMDSEGNQRNARNCGCFANAWDLPNANNCQANMLLGPKWDNMNDVPVLFNPTLDTLLESIGNLNLGGAQDRAESFIKAGEAWNCALAFVGATMRIDGGSPFANDWAIDWQVQNPPLGPPTVACMEPASNKDVYWYFWGHNTDQINAVSTGHNHTNWTDPAMNRIPDGWVVDPETDIDALARTKPRVNPMDNTKLIESDIGWVTHTILDCKQFPWDYLLRAGLRADQTDYYSVMLHELGHLLGLDHQGPQGVSDNVMRPQISPEQNLKVRQGEIDCLCKLYGAACAAQAIDE